MNKDMASEKIVIFWRFGYFKLFDSRGNQVNDRFVLTEDYDWARIFWRFYYREAYYE